MSAEIRHISVVGAGLMGHGIALEFAVAGYDVSLHSRTQASLDWARTEIQLSLDKLVHFELVTPERANVAPERIQTTTVFEKAVKDADLVIETVSEDLAAKQQLFERLDRTCPEHTILASNTSSFMPSMLAANTGRTDKILVAHYVNPPHLVPLVEIVPTAQTSDETIDTVTELLTGMGKRPIVLRKEVPGFLLNRLQAALLREALWMVENGVASPQDIDLGIRSSLGRRWSVAGVFEIFDMAGWDVLEAMTTAVNPSLASAPDVSPLVKQKVAAGDLGAKSGKGFYDWTPESAAALRQRIAAALVEIEKWETRQE